MNENFVRLIFSETQDERVPKLFAAMTETALIKYVNEDEDSYNVEHYVTSEGDYVYEIKRIAAPWVHSPIYGVMSEHILGLS